MSYIEDVERELRRLLSEVLAHTVAPDAVVIFVKRKIAQSYKNGMQATERAKGAQRAATRRDPAY